MKTSKIDVIRAWKDEAYRMSLSETERSGLPENPAGTLLDLAEIADVSGAQVVETGVGTCTISWERCCCSGDLVCK